MMESVPRSEAGHCYNKYSHGSPENREHTPHNGVFDDCIIT